MESHTDGSKSEMGVGAAATIGNRTKSASLPKFSSIFTAQTHAILLALNTIFATKGKSFTIITDSRSYLQTLQKQILTDPKVRKLKHTKASLQKIGKQWNSAGYLDTQVFQESYYTEIPATKAILEFQETDPQMKKPKKLQDGKKK